MDLEGPGGGGEKKGRTRDQERREKEKRLMRIWGGEERITRDRLCHVKLPLSTHVLPFPSSPSLPLCGQHNSQSQGNRLRGFDLLNFRAGA